MTAATLAFPSLLVLAVSGPQPARLAVPIVEQAPERSGPAALGMVRRFYGAPDSALERAAAVYDRRRAGSLALFVERAP